LVSLPLHLSQLQQLHRPFLLEQQILHKHQLLRQRVLLSSSELLHLLQQSLHSVLEEVLQVLLLRHLGHQQLLLLLVLHQQQQLRLLSEELQLQLCLSQLESSHLVPRQHRQQ